MKSLISLPAEGGGTTRGVTEGECESSPFLTLTATYQSYTMAPSVSHSLASSLPEGATTVLPLRYLPEEGYRKERAVVPQGYREFHSQAPPPLR